LTRLGVSPKSGLDSPMVTRRLAKYGRNVISPPPRNLARKIFFYIFGGLPPISLIIIISLSSSFLQDLGACYSSLVLYASLLGKFKELYHITPINLRRCATQETAGKP
jgi:sodium/potassium-transporting ATPase subunit alpha